MHSLDFVSCCLANLCKPVRFVGAFCLTLLVISPMNCYAGYYGAPVYTNGSLTAAGGSAVNYASYGGGWGGSRSNSGSAPWADASGDITATFTWVPAEEGDDPPTKVIIKEICTATWNGGGYGTPTGTANNGLGFSQVTTYSGGTSSGTRYTAKNGGNSVSITCSPSSHAACTNGQVQASLTYIAVMLVPEISLTGGIGPSSKKRYLIGQHGIADLSVTDLTPTTFNWSISGCFPFKNYVADNSSGVYTPMGSETGNFMGFYFAKPGTATISCAVHLTPGAGAKPEAGLDVTLTRSCGVEAPTWTHQEAIGLPRLDPVPPGVPTGIRLYDATLNGLTGAGTLWQGTVTTPADFVGTYGLGTWGRVQLITPQDITYTLNGVLYNLKAAWHYVERLDGSFLYLDRNHIPDGGLYTDPDSPGVDFAAGMTSCTMSMSFKNYMMYKPGGESSCFVPLYNFFWSFDFSGTKGGNGNWTVSITNFPTIQAGTDFPSHPVWNLLWSNNPQFDAN